MSEQILPWFKLLIYVGILTLPIACAGAAIGEMPHWLRRTPYTRAEVKQTIRSLLIATLPFALWALSVLGIFGREAPRPVPTSAPIVTPFTV
jgi:hypothetical protein